MTRYAEIAARMDPQKLQIRSTALNTVLGSDRWRDTTPHLLRLDPQSLGTRSARLSAVLGHERWKETTPIVLGVPENEVQARGEALTYAFGSNLWKTKAPALLLHATIDKQEMKTRVDRVTQALGHDQWKSKRLSLLIIPTNVVQLRSDAITHALQSDSWKTKTPNLLLFATTDEQEMKKKADTISSILGTEDWKRGKPYLLRLDTNELSARVQQLTMLFHGTEWRYIGNLYFGDIATISERVRKVSALLGNDTWTGVVPRLAIVPFEEIERRAHYIEQLTGNDKYKRGNHYFRLLTLRINTIERNAQALDALFPNGAWKRYPQLLLAPKLAAKNAPAIDAIFGNTTWRSNPQIALQSPKTLQAYAADHTKNFGSTAWMRNPTLISITPATFNASLRMMRLAGINPTNTDLRSMGLILSTRISTKRGKIKFIRERLLGHTQVHIYDRKLHMEDYVALRRNIRTRERVQEQIEIAETVEFIRRHPSLLGYSENAILSWGRRNGYNV